MDTHHKPVRGTLLFVGLLLVMAAAVIWLLLFDLQPAVSHPGALTHEQRIQVEQIIVDNSPPRFQRSGDSQVVLTADELDLLVALALESIPGLHEVSARFDLSGPDIRLQLTRPVRTGPVTWFLNIHSRLGIDDDQLSVRSLRAGQFPIPQPIQRMLLQSADTSLRSYSIDYRELLELQESITSLALVNHQLSAHLKWQPEVITELRSQAQQMFVSAEDRERLIHYYRTILGISVELAGTGRSSSVHTYLQLLFAEASKRTERGEDPVTENRSLLQALALYVNDLELATLVHDAPADLRSSRRSHAVTLVNRTDLTRHFVTSAAITASAGATIADVLANSKELHDARYSTGFSFSDITANTAGVMLGQSATTGTVAAGLLQQRIMEAEDERAYMPTVDRSEDGLSETEFTEKYGNRDSEIYRQRIRIIEQQISSLPLYL